MNLPYKLVSIKNITQDFVLKNFDCNFEELNVFLARYALKNDEIGIGKTFVALDAQGQVAGFFTLATAQIAYQEIPEDYKERLPKYPMLALRIARLAVDSKFQGKGIGKWLLLQAFIKAIQVSDVTGLYFIIVDAKESSKTFYEKYGFVKLSNKNNTYFILIETVRKAMQSD